MVAMNPLNNRRGQIAILYALLVPILLFLGGVGLDLGWYYMNVSRLQNAADAAVLVGANKLIEEHDTFKDKNYKAKLVDKFPASNPAYDTTNNLKKSTSGKLIDTTIGDEAALDYAKKNLSSNDTGYALPSLFSVAYAEDDLIKSYTLTDNYTRGDSTITLAPALYKDSDNNYYYVLHLTEDIHHFFVGFLGDMEAPVVAVAMISKDSSDIPKVVFDANGGKIRDTSDGSESDTVEIKGISAPVTIKLPNGYEPTLDGYGFTGWNTKADGSGESFSLTGNKGKDIFTQDELKAFFEAYDPNSGNAGYNYSKEGVVTLYAMWEANKTQPKITFDANGGSFGDNTTTASKDFKAASEMEDDEVSDPLTTSKGTPTNGSKTFKGWTTEKYKDAGDGDIIKIYLDGDQLTKEQMEELFGDGDEVTLYAVWEDVRPDNNRTLWEQMQYLIAKNVYDPDWTVSAYKFGAALNDLYFIPTGNEAVLKNNKIVYITMSADTTTNNSKAYVKDVDRLFLDFRPDGFIVRVHALINVNAAYDVRSGHVGKDDDPLYIRIEAEPKVGATGNEPQQIIININADNTADSKRPLFFYYDGPLTYNGTYPDRVAQPVILNMTTDFKGVLFMPDVPVVINGNGHKFEGFIVAKEFRYAAKYGSKTAKYTQNGDAMYYYIDSDNNIYTTSATGTNALDTYNKYATKAKYSGFNLSNKSEFKTFTADTGVNFTYVYYNYDSNPTMDETPFHEYSDKNNDLVPLYRLNANGEQVRVTKWEDVNLYDSDDFETRNLIPKTVTDTSKKGTVRLTNGSPSPVYDEAGNPVYFCESYVKVTGSYDVFTLNRVDDGTRNEHEFLLTADTTNISGDDNVSDTDDWK